MVVLTLVLAWVGRPLQTVAAPRGILDFEFAGTAERAREILASWSPLARQQAAFSLGLDYLYIPVYAAALGSVCLWAGDRLRSRRLSGQGLGTLLAWGLGLAALLDAVENAALARILFYGPEPVWPAVASLCAGGKFAVILCSAIYLLLSLVFLIRSRSD